MPPEEYNALPPIIQMWITQLTDPDIVAMVKTFGDRRRIDLMLFSDRGRCNRPPKHTII